MKTVPVIQCNHVGWEGSTDVSLRRDARGRYVIEAVMDRALAIIRRDAQPILACPDLPENRIFGELAAAHGCPVFYGSNDNVLERLVLACRQQGGARVAWLQGIHYFLHAGLMDRLLDWSTERGWDYARCPDGTLKFMLGQVVCIPALERAQRMIAALDPQAAGFYRARPFAFMRSRPADFAVGLFEELPVYAPAEWEAMRAAARDVYLEERAMHSAKGVAVGDISRGRYLNILDRVPDSGTILDIACGSGYGAAILDNGRRRIVGVDVSPEAVAFAKEHNGGHAEFRLGNAERIPADDASVDAAVSIATIEHVADDAAFVRELARVLKPGGRVIIYTPQNRMGRNPIWPWHCREYSIPELRDLVGAYLKVDAILGWLNGIVADTPEGDGMFLVARKPD